MDVLSPAEKRAVKLVYLIWKNMDFEKMKRSRLLGIWDEFQNKLKFASFSQTPERFLETLARRLGLQSLKHPEILALLDYETLRIIRNQPRKVVLFLRGMVEVERKKIRTAEEKREMNAYMEAILSEYEKEFSELLERRGING